MRKYYKPRNVLQRSSTRKMIEKLSPWDILRSYAEGAVGPLGWDLLCRVISIANKRDIEGYLLLVDDLDKEIQMYSESTRLSVIYAHRQVCTLLKKYPFRKSDHTRDTRKTAIGKWMNAESQCSETNERMSNLSYDDTPSWVPRAQQLIASVLGDLTPSLIMKIINSGEHGPGSTLTSNGNRVTPYYKYAELPYSFSKECKSYAYAAISSDPNWVRLLESSGRRTELPPAGSPLFQKELMLFQNCVVERDSDKITFVPKDCRSDRPIAVGASMNMFIQLGVKSHMEACLKKHGVDLSSQAKNRAFARIGSMTKDPNCPNQYSTIDLASASDTVSIGLVKLLLPWNWFAFLDDLRHKSGILDGLTHVYSKFSAMGNGFTFPLESLLFWAISKSSIEALGDRCTNNDIAVYGDDIIVRFKHAPHVISALNWSGFQVNNEKSFLTGFFKESCGEDYFRGYNVRPLYIKREIKSYEDIYYVCNWITKKILSTSYPTCWNSTYEALLEKVPQRDRSYGPLSSRRLAPRRYHDSMDIAEDFLEVPLRFMSSSGLRPWLSFSEKDALNRSKLLDDEDSFTQSQFVIRVIDVPIAYKARGLINYMLRLRTLDNDRTFDPFSKLTSNSSGNTVSRRNATKRVIKVLPVLSWDSHYLSHEIAKHPLSFYSSKNI